LTRKQVNSSARRSFSPCDFLCAGEAGEYRVVFAPAGKARPKDFDSKSGSQHHVHVWKRVKA